MAISMARARDFHESGGCVEELPPYEVIPQVKKLSSQDLHLRPVLAIKLTDREIDHGSFVAGEVLYTPRWDVSVPYVMMSLMSEQQSSCRGSLLQGGRISTRSQTIAKTVFELQCNKLSSGHLYTLPFSLRFPGPGRMCQCEFCVNDRPVHSAYPPSLGISDACDSHYGAVVRYYVSVQVDSGLKTREWFKFAPKHLCLNLGRYVDAKGTPLNREYFHALPIKPWRHRGVPECVLVAVGNPHSKNVCADRSGYYIALLRISPSDNVVGSIDLTVKSVSLAVTKSIFGARSSMRNVLDKTPDTNVTSYKVPVMKPVQDFNICRAGSSNQWRLKIWYEFKEDTKFLSPESYVGCLSAVTYTLEIKINHNLGSSTLAVPLVLTSDCLPSYLSTITAESVPSLVSDDG